jgi:hypothetical protein
VLLQHGRRDTHQSVHSLVGAQLDGRSETDIASRRHTRRSVPDDFKAAQSRGLCPGARATFSRFLEGFWGRCVVVVGTRREDEAEDEDLFETPGVRRARDGTGGGGIRAESERIRGVLDGAARWALLRAGNAGTELSSVSVSSPSSSDAGGEILLNVGISGVAVAGAPVSQLRR